MKIQAAILLALVLAVSGCAADKDEAEPADTSSQSASKSRALDLLDVGCDLDDRGISSCTSWLTDLVSTAYDAYEESGSPESATDYYDRVNTMSGNYGQEFECGDQSGSGTTQCQTLYGNIVSSVESLLDALP